MSTLCVISAHKVRLAGISARDELTVALPMQLSSHKQATRCLRVDAVERGRRSPKLPQPTVQTQRKSLIYCVLASATH